MSNSLTPEQVCGSYGWLLHTGSDTGYSTIYNGMGSATPYTIINPNLLQISSFAAANVTTAATCKVYIDGGLSAAGVWYTGTAGTLLNGNAVGKWIFTNSALLTRDSINSTAFSGLSNAAFIGNFVNPGLSTINTAVIGFNSATGLTTGYDSFVIPCGTNLNVNNSLVKKSCCSSNLYDSVPAVGIMCNLSSSFAAFDSIRSHRTCLATNSFRSNQSINSTTITCTALQRNSFWRTGAAALSTINATMLATGVGGINCNSTITIAAAAICNSTNSFAFNTCVNVTQNLVNALQVNSNNGTVLCKIAGNCQIFNSTAFSSPSGHYFSSTVTNRLSYGACFYEKQYSIINKFYALSSASSINNSAPQSQMESNQLTTNGVAIGRNSFLWAASNDGNTCINTNACNSAIIGRACTLTGAISANNSFVPASHGFGGVSCDNSSVAGYGSVCCGNNSFGMGCSYTVTRDGQLALCGGGGIVIADLPTSSAGLPCGHLWRCTADNSLRIVLT